MMGETVAKQGAMVLQVLYMDFYEDANYKYLDVRVTGGVWQLQTIL